MKSQREHKAFVCSECGFDSPKWSGQCPGCGQWNTMSEFTVRQTAAQRFSSSAASGNNVKYQKLNAITHNEEKRMLTGIEELDRVLGGGAVCGSLVLLSGEPGIGKSTLLLQACANICREQSVLYVSGEESPSQIKMRAERLGIKDEDIFIASETNIDEIIAAASELKPSIVIIDSIQTVYKAQLDNTPGSVTQVRESTFDLMRFAKTSGTTVIVVGHVNKDGGIAGPKVLEHMVDCVLNFEGERHISYRLLRAVKNRFGSTNEIGVFEMCEDGLKEVPNPSETLLSGRPTDAPGSCVACVMEGTRPLLAEVQALVSATAFNMPRRMSTGVDYNRASLILAILEKRAGLNLSTRDAYINVIGGLKIDEPAIDLPCAIAVASSVSNRPVRTSIAAFGELGLTGEVRAVNNAVQRINEIKRLGFTKCIVPAQTSRTLPPEISQNLIPVRNISEAIAAALE